MPGKDKLEIRLGTLLPPLSSQPGGLGLHLLHDLRQVLTVDVVLLKTGVNKYTLDVGCCFWPKMLWVGGAEQPGLWL